MRITDTGFPFLNRAAESGKLDARTGEKPGVAAPGRDSLQLSGLAAAVQALAPGSAERAGKLARLEGAVGSGRYHVDAQQVGRSLVEEALLAA